MARQPKLVPFINALGVTSMVYDTALAVEPAEDILPIDHVRWVYAIGALACAALLLALPFLFVCFGAIACAAPLLALPFLFAC